MHPILAGYDPVVGGGGNYESNPANETQKESAEQSTAFGHIVETAQKVVNSMVLFTKSLKSLHELLHTVQHVGSRINLIAQTALKHCSS